MQFNHHKKIEKISQAIYLATQHLKDKEPLKWELRRECVSFLSCSSSLNDEFFSKDISDSSMNISVDALLSIGKEIISFLTLSRTAGIISPHNTEIIVSEIELIFKTFENESDELAVQSGFVLSDDFFRHLDKSEDKNIQGTLAKPIENKTLVKQNMGLTVKGNLKEKKDSRRERIIDLLRKKSNLTIKDFILVINDCSLKTIQRELSILVKIGIVKMEGERRWSNYSLK